MIFFHTESKSKKKFFFFFGGGGGGGGWEGGGVDGWTDEQAQPICPFFFEVGSITMH